MSFICRPASLRWSPGRTSPGFIAAPTENQQPSFLPTPLTEKLAYPVVYGQSYQDSTIIREVTLNFNGKSYPVKLEFKPYQSLFLQIKEKDGARFGDIYFMPQVPVKE